MITLDELLNNDYDCVCMSFKNMLDVLSEAIQRVTSEDELVGVDFDKTRNGYRISYSYTGFSYDCIDIHITEEAADEEIDYLE